jgi:hypothetical protein
MMTDWLVYRCDECRVTHFVNVLAADWRPECSHAVRLVGLCDEHQFCETLGNLR